jgi:hypothetical protein
MRRTIILVLALTMLMVLPSLAGRVVTTPKVHVIPVYQVCAATSPCTSSSGYVTSTTPVISAAPGILSIDPGNTWANFVAASQTTAQAAIGWTIKNVTLVKVTPPHVQCKLDANGNPIFPVHTVTQQGTANIRTWWPLMYEIPSTTFTLTILYGTPNLFDDDGTGPNPPAWVHVEQWTWHVEATIDTLEEVLELFHELPFGLDEVPLISDEPLYTALQAKLVAANAAYGAGDLAGAAFIMGDFELEVMDACIDVSPSFPNPTGPGTGIANSDENPACCKLLIDVEYILQTTGIGQPKK